MRRAVRRATPRPPIILVGRIIEPAAAGNQGPARTLGWLAAPCTSMHVKGSVRATYEPFVSIPPTVPGSIPAGGQGSQSTQLNTIRHMVIWLDPWSRERDLLAAKWGPAGIRTYAP